jgi:MoaA/NifB/PqqE/SkfB family radical SAM enzyme
MRVCCHANPSESGGILRDADGVPYNAATADLVEARNAPLLKEVRQTMRKGEWHAACVRCQNEERSNIRSRRNYETEIWRDSLNEERALRGTAADGSIDTQAFPLEHADIRFGNLCNLKCRSCGPTDSSKWYSDYVKLRGNTFREQTVNVTLNDEKGRFIPSPNLYQWHESPQFWVQLEKQMPSIRQMYLVGGEPLLIEAHYDFLEKCVREGHAPRIKIEYNSNITAIPERAWRLWRHFRLVQVGASIDGIGAVNDYIRHPSKWPTVLDNLMKLDNAEGEFRVLISSTVMIYNVLHLPDMLIWKARQNFKRVNMDSWKPLITPHPLHKPTHLNIQALPHEVKQKVAALYEEKKLEVADAIRSSSLKDKERAIASGTGLMDKYLDFMWQKDLSREFGNFWDYTSRLDAIRKESLERSIPDLYRTLLPYLPSSQLSAVHAGV